MFNYKKTKDKMEELFHSTSEKRNKLYDLLLYNTSSKRILKASLELYNITCQERYLLQALSLLNQMGKKAWPALEWLSKSNEKECELFIELTANCEGVSLEERQRAISSLSESRHLEVRRAVYENFEEFEKEIQHHLSCNNIKYHRSALTKVTLNWVNELTKVNDLQQQLDALMSCRRGLQKCHECPDLQCTDNMLKRETKK